MNTYTFKIQGITCESCIKLIKMSLREIQSNTEISLDLNGKLQIKSDREITKNEIVKALSDLKHYKVL